VSLPEKDLNIVRDLAKKLAEVANLPEQKEKADLWKKLNRLEHARPMIMLHNGTWHETSDQIKLEAEDGFARQHEWHLRATLYHHQNMPDDSVYEAKIHSPIFVGSTGMGIGTNATRPDHVFGAAKYNDALPANADPSIIPMPTVTVDWDATEKHYQTLCEIYDGILTVEKRGVAGHWFSIMDTFIQWHGLQNTFTDMIDRPEWVHSWMERMTQWHLIQLDQYEKLGVLSLNNGNNGVGSGGLGFTDELPQKDFDGTHVRTIDQWGHATTQIFSEVSPAMHEEFALKYERQFLARFGLNNYGCCEPLDKKINIIRSIPNLRRISMSPWVDPERGAQELKKDYIFSYKPNPAIIGMETWNVDLARKILKDALDKSRGCIVEVIMKDLHNCRKEPWRMWEWVKMAKQLAEEYA
jgi:hypothetical protein